VRVEVLVEVVEVTTFVLMDIFEIEMDVVESGA
jgi:hypothetical protein